MYIYIYAIFICKTKIYKTVHKNIKRQQCACRKKGMNSLAVVISVITQKGGVGKTTVVNALCASLSKRRYRVLAIDMDPQGNLSLSFDADSDNAATIYDVLKGEALPIDSIQRQPVADIIPSNILLSSIELEFTGKNREFLLSNIIEQVTGLYDIILIDSPPGLGILTINALTASDYVIIPMLPDIFSLQGLTLVYDTIEYIQSTVNKKLAISGILVNRYMKRSKLHKEIYGTAQLICHKLNVNLFKTVIRNSKTLAEAQSIQTDITEYSPKSSGVKDFNSLVTELEELNII